MTSPTPPLPTFVIIGAQKSATRWLRSNLGKHPDIFTPASEPSLLQLPLPAGPRLLLRPVRGMGGEPIVGEATPGYMMWRHKPSRVAAPGPRDAPRGSAHRGAARPDRAGQLGHVAPQAPGSAPEPQQAHRRREAQETDRRQDVHRHRRLVRDQPREVRGAVRRSVARLPPRRHLRGSPLGVSHRARTHRRLARLRARRPATDRVQQPAPREDEERHDPVARGPPQALAVLQRRGARARADDRP